MVPFLLLAIAVDAGAQGPRVRRSLLEVNAWAGPFTDMSGFSDGPAFYSFDGKLGLGGGIHVSTTAGIMIGVEGFYTKPSYNAFATGTTEPDTVATGEATVWSALASARFAGGGGILAIYLAGGAGVMSWDIPDVGERKTDLALTLGLGVDLYVLRYVIIFGQYDNWWVYHEKDEDIQSNTANPNVLRFGLRYGIL
jgi:hypothetical protein